MKLQSHTKKKQKLFQYILMKSKQSVKRNFYILLAFLSITKTLLVAVSIYCYLIKYGVMQKHLLSFYVTNSELKEIMH